MAADDQLSCLTRFGYGCGHAQNDLCAAMYFSYLLIFLQTAEVGLGQIDAGVVLLTGQFADGLATPIVGHFSDRTNLGRGYCGGLIGRRKIWHMGGVVVVSATYSTLFTPGFQFDGAAAACAFYSTMNCLFQLGWASAQVSHMALVPEITDTGSERVVLNSIRFWVTVLCSIIVYCALLGGVSSSAATPLSFILNILAICSVVIGLVAALVFIALVVEVKAKPGWPTLNRLAAIQETIDKDNKKRKFTRSGFDDQTGLVFYQNRVNGEVTFIDPELQLMNEDEEDDTRTGYRNPLTENPLNAIRLAPPMTNEELISVDSSLELPPPKTLLNWMAVQGFGQVCVAYGLTRICVNCFQLYIPLFVIVTLQLETEVIATLPLTVYISMWLSAMAAPSIHGRFGFFGTYLFGATCIFASGIMFYTHPSSAESPWPIFVAGFLGGVGNSQVMVAVQTLVGLLVGSDPHGAVVFGFNSAMDKVGTGAAIFIIQVLAQGYTDTHAASLTVNGSTETTLLSTAGSHSMTSTPELQLLYRVAVGIVPPLCAALALLSVFLIPMSIRGSDEGGKEVVPSSVNALDYHLTEGPVDVNGTGGLRTRANTAAIAFQGATSGIPVPLDKLAVGRKQKPHSDGIHLMMVEKLPVQGGSSRSQLSPFDGLRSQ